MKPEEAQDGTRTEAPRIDGQYAPRPISTDGSVLSNSFMSSQRDCDSMYAISSSTCFSKGISERPDTCHMHVMPGMTSSLCRSARLYIVTSDGTGGRGPTNDISPLNTLNSCGNSSIE